MKHLWLGKLQTSVFHCHLNCYLNCCYKWLLAWLALFLRLWVILGWTRRFFSIFWIKTESKPLSHSLLTPGLVCKCLRTFCISVIDRKNVAGFFWPVKNSIFFFCQKKRSKKEAFFIKNRQKISKKSPQKTLLFLMFQNVQIFTKSTAFTS